MRDFGCGAVVLATLTIEIQDQLEVQIFNDLQDTVLVCGGACTQLVASGASTYFWQPPGLFNDPGIANPTVCPDSSRLVVVSGTLGICNDAMQNWVLTTRSTFHHNLLSPQERKYSLSQFRR